MNEEDHQDQRDNDSLLAEASQWFGRMRGPEAEKHREEFEAWLARGALHRAFYNLASETFANGKFLKDEGAASAAPDQPFGSDAPGPRPSDLGSGKKRRWKRYGALATLAVTGAGVFTYVSSMLLPPRSSSEQMAQQSPTRHRGLHLTTRAGQVLAQRLSDGSKVTLEPDSALTVDFGPAQRSLRLERGKSRFEVAHEGRPFVVFAGTGSIIARGTIFEVTLLQHEQVAVHLVRGKVDVVAPGRGDEKPAVHHLTAGEIITYAPLAPARKVAIDADGTLLDASVAAPVPAEMQEFSQAPLSDVIAAANLRGGPPIRLDKPDLPRLKVSGRFRLDDHEKLAEKLGLIFDLTIDRSSRPAIVLRRR